MWETVFKLRHGLIVAGNDFISHLKMNNLGTKLMCQHVFKDLMTHTRWHSFSTIDRGRCVQQFQDHLAQGSKTDITQHFLKSHLKGLVCVLCRNPA